MREQCRRLAGGTDWWLFLAACTAGIYGWILVYSACTNAGIDGHRTQAIGLLSGIVGAVVLSTRKPSQLKRSAPFVFAAVLLLMALTFTPLGYQVPGTDDRNWLMFPLGSRQLLLQPSEFLKIAFLLTFSRHLSAVEGRHDLPTVLGLLAHAAAPVILLLLQGDDGNAVVFFLLAVSLLFLSGIRARWFVGGAALIGAALPFVWTHLTDDKRARFLCLIRVEDYLSSAGFQQYHGLIAIGSGRLFGIGYRQGGSGYLYARHNDFIFTVAAEEYGLIGAVFVLISLLAVILGLYRVAKRTRDRFGYYLCGGMMALLIGQSVLNLGMCLRLLPVLGITLPFFSAGGSSLLSLYFGIGLAMSVSRADRPVTARLFS